MADYKKGEEKWYLGKKAMRWSEEGIELHNRMLFCSSALLLYATSVDL